MISILEHSHPINTLHDLGKSFKLQRTETEPLISYHDQCRRFYVEDIKQYLYQKYPILRHYEGEIFEISYQYVNHTNRKFLWFFDRKPECSSIPKIHVEWMREFQRPTDPGIKHALIIQANFRTIHTMLQDYRMLPIWPRDGQITESDAIIVMRVTVGLIQEMVTAMGNHVFSVYQSFLDHPAEVVNALRNSIKLTQILYQVTFNHSFGVPHVVDLNPNVFDYNGTI